MVCMSISPYFYFSNNINSIGCYLLLIYNILFDFPSSQWFNFFVVDLVLAWEVLKGLSLS